MGPLDVFYVVALLLGGGYSLVSILMGGVSHVAHVAGHLGSVGGEAGAHAAHVGDAHTGATPAGHAGHVGEAAAHGAVHGAAHHGHLDLGHHAHHGDAAHHGSDQGDSGDAEDESGRMNILAYLSPTLLAGLLLGIGTGGLASRLAGVQPAPSLAFAGGGGALLWGSAYLIVTKLFGGAQGSSHTHRDDALGMPATVTVPIAGSKPGIISLVLAGTHQSMRAVSDDGKPIPVGAQVRVRRIAGGTAIVTQSAYGAWLEPQSPAAGAQDAEQELELKDEAE